MWRAAARGALAECRSRIATQDGGPSDARGASSRKTQRSEP
ncbi:hypothetical protein C7S16_5233 [Burkholderia thailandensis]|uniref:Uncharacterized protein n=1 Tax=Burkholderia thailandensis TaxID=57975 RepID=A0AAW9CSW2_BURTH|nr:hypothetical protein [Burkholderia thailandensis]MDW9252921.1 hypothetical protein [Burkholderia thailandensis]